MGKEDISEIARELGPEEVGKRIKRVAEKKLKEAEQSSSNGAQDPIRSDPGPDFRDPGHFDDAGKDDEKLYEELLSKYESAFRTAEEFQSMTIVPRKRILGNWMKEGDLGFVFGERGSGKTWFVDAIATHLSTGEDLFEWDAPEAADVTYVDGEMPGDDARLRIMGLSPGNKRLHILHHEVLFDLTGLAMNLVSPTVQRVITALCVKSKSKLLILDNLSCLFSGMKENDADEWEKVLNWLLNLRRRRIAVLIVAHGSRTGTMRGTSRREDAAFWVIKTEEIGGRDQNEMGAKFQTTFTKQRNSDSQEWSRVWTFKTEEDGKVSIGCEEISFDGKVLQLIQDGITGASDLAAEVQSSKATICRAAKRLIDKNLIELSNRQYRPRGFMKK